MRNWLQSATHFQQIAYKCKANAAKQRWLSARYKGNILKIFSLNEYFYVENCIPLYPKKSKYESNSDAICNDNESPHTLCKHLCGASACGEEISRLPGRQSRTGVFEPAALLSVDFSCRYVPFYAPALPVAGLLSSCIGVSENRE